MKKKTSSQIEDERRDKAQRTYTGRNPKRHIPLVSLLLWRKMVAVHCFIWPVALRLWSVSGAVRLKFEFWQFKKIYISATCKCFVAFDVLYGLVLFRKGDFGRIKCLWGDIKRRNFERDAKVSLQSLLKRYYHNV